MYYPHYARSVAQKQNGHVHKEAILQLKLQNTDTQQLSEHSSYTLQLAVSVLHQFLPLSLLYMFRALSFAFTFICTSQADETERIP